jgi:hypothetical protein
MSEAVRHPPFRSECDGDLTDGMLAGAAALMGSGVLINELTVYCAFHYQRTAAMLKRDFPGITVVLVPVEMMKSPLVWVATHPRGVFVSEPKS